MLDGGLAWVWFPLYPPGCPGGWSRRSKVTKGTGDTKPQEPAGGRGNVAAIQRRDLANGATGLDEIRCNPIKMH